MREHLRTILTCLAAVGLLAWVVPLGSLAGPQTSTQPHGRLPNARASLTNMSGAACSLASVSGTPAEDTWQITYAAHAGSAVVATAVSRLFNRSVVEIIAETDTSTTLISGLTLIWSDTVATTDIDVISVYSEIPLKSQSDSALWVATLDTVITVNDTVLVDTGFDDSIMVATDDTFEVTIVDTPYVLQADTVEVLIVEQPITVDTGYDDSLWVMVDDSVLVWQSHDWDVSVQDSAKVWHTEDLRVSVQDSAAIYHTEDLRVAVQDSAKVYHTEDLRVAVQDSALIYVSPPLRVSVDDSALIWQSHDLDVAVQDSVKMWHTHDIRVAVQDSALVYVSNPMAVTTNAQDLRDNPDYTNSYVDDAVDPDSTGQAGFNYIYECSLAVSDTLRVPTAGSRIHLDGVAWSWVVEYGDDDQDKLHFAVYSGKAMTDSLFWWTGTPDELMKANHKVHPFQITLKPDSALVVKSANTKRGNDAALLRIYLPGYEKAD